MSRTELLDDAAVLAEAAVDLLRETTSQLEAVRSTRGRTAAYARVRRRLERQVNAAVRGVRGGTLSPLDATHRFAAAYERAALEAAHGSAARVRAAPGSATFAAVETEVDRTSHAFGGFMSDLAAGAEPGQRPDLYVRRLDGFRNKVWADGASGPDVLWWWELGSGDHCVDCLTLHLESPFQDRPPTVPRMGGTICGANCGCVLSTTSGGEEPGT
jgi:hypothetical protein